MPCCWGFPLELGANPTAVPWFGEGNSFSNDCRVSKTVFDLAKIFDLKWFAPKARQHTSEAYNMYLDLMHDECLHKHTARQLVNHVKGAYRTFDLEDLPGKAIDDGYPTAGHNTFSDGSVNPADSNF